MNIHTTHQSEAVKHLKYRHFEKEYFFQTSRSSGPGGQNVNKTETKVELRFHVEASLLLSDEEKYLIKSRFQQKINAEGFLQIIVQESRSQLTNKQLAEERFYILLMKAFKKHSIRKASKPTLGSVKRRLITKKYTSKIKEQRSKNIISDNEMG
ncbi:MAG: alternative ribosome rescue aminoacyl-tRNA hydrolase ArfB [Bacteroidales bacterium]